MSARLFPTHRVMWLPLGYPWRPALARVTHCCQRMAMALEFTCTQHADPMDCPDTALIYHEPFDEYGIPIRDGGTGYLLIDNCPWCGTRLPASQRDRWFDELEAAGLDESDADALPAAYLTAEWRSRRA
ncbi:MULTISPECIES: hypothetical protein [Rhodomicrobium]|uniref:DUF6980 family protein n=1 Tax=Rhodomicrobium TaxID=1068 RepID=UPI001AECA6E8|nr:MULTISPECIES: hypothetical protein [Rhodomicrobium]